MWKSLFLIRMRSKNISYCIIRFLLAFLQPFYTGKITWIYLKIIDNSPYLCYGTAHTACIDKKKITNLDHINQSNSILFVIETFEMFFIIIIWHINFLLSHCIAFSPSLTSNPITHRSQAICRYRFILSISISRHILRLQCQQQCTQIKLQTDFCVFEENEMAFLLSASLGEWHG